MSTGALLSPTSTGYHNLNSLNLNGARSEDPDILFRDHSVAEVKQIRSRLKLDVDVKEHELRTMVGERYRELLQASTAILEMNKASHRVLERLAKIQVACRSQAELSVAERASSGVEQDEQLQRLQVLASHVKLLLDAPEHLWRLLEQKMFIQAGCLFLLARLVYQALKSHELEDGRPLIPDINIAREFPVVHRQWELISQFRAQIVHRSKQALRDYDEDSLKPGGQLLALHILENISLKEGLTLLLDSRLRNFGSILSSTSSTGLNASAISESHKMLQARDVLACTVSAAHAIFIGRESLNSQGLFMQAVSEMQQDATSQEDTLIPSVSNLMKILPSSAYLSALPTSIKSYRPIFDPLSPVYATPVAELEAQVSSWIGRAMEDIRAPLTKLFESADSIQAVWSLQKRFSLNESENTTFRILCQRWNHQLYEIARSQTTTLWRRHLTGLKTEFQLNLNHVIDEMTNRTRDYELGSRVLLSSMTERIKEKSISSTVLSALRKSLQNSLTMFAPQAHSVVHDLEQSASQLSDEIGSVDSLQFQMDLSTEYQRDALQVMKDILVIIESTRTGSFSDPRNNFASASHLALLCGQVSRALAFSPTFLSDLRIPIDNTKVLQSSLLSIYETSLQDWQEAFIIRESTDLRKRLKPSLLSTEYNTGALHIPNHPSTPVFQFCCNFTRFARQHDMDLINDRRNITKRFQDSFLAIITDSLKILEEIHELQYGKLFQIILDLCFLDLLATSCFDATESTRDHAIASLKHHQKRYIEEANSKHSELFQQLQPNLEGLINTIQSSRLLFTPLFGELHRSDQVTLLEVPSAGSLDNSFSSTLRLVKPSSRVAMLHITS